MYASTPSGGPAMLKKPLIVEDKYWHPANHPWLLPQKLKKERGNPLPSYKMPKPLANIFFENFDG